MRVCNRVLEYGPHPNTGLLSIYATQALQSLKVGQRLYLMNIPSRLDTRPSASSKAHAWRLVRLVKTKRLPDV